MYWNVPRMVPCAVSGAGAFGRTCGVRQQPRFDRARRGDAPSPDRSRAACNAARLTRRSREPETRSPVSDRDGRCRGDAPCRAHRRSGPRGRSPDRPAARPFLSRSASVSPSRCSMTRYDDACRVVPDVVERADVRMIERGDALRFALEARPELGIGREGGRQHLDGDGALEAGVAGLVDLAHAAGADGADDLVRSEARAGGQGHGEGASLMQSRASGVSSAHAYHDSCSCNCSRVDCRRPPGRHARGRRRAVRDRDARLHRVRDARRRARTVDDLPHATRSTRATTRSAARSIMVHGTNRNADHYFETVDRRGLSRRRARGHRRHRAAHDRSDRQARGRTRSSGRAAGARAGRRARRRRCRRSISSTRSSASSRTRRRSRT